MLTYENNNKIVLMKLDDPMDGAEYISIEEQLPGTFLKYNSNGKFVNQNCEDSNQNQNCAKSAVLSSFIVVMVELLTKSSQEIDKV